MSVVIDQRPVRELFEIARGAGQEAAQVANALRETIAHHFKPASRQQESLQAKFARLRMQWHDETEHLSSPAAMALHPAYQSIIGMGENVVPLLLHELECAPDHWFWALRAITGIDPVRQENRGRVDRMAAEWIRWGRAIGYLR